MKAASILLVTLAGQSQAADWIPTSMADLTETFTDKTFYKGCVKGLLEDPTGFAVSPCYLDYQSLSTTTQTVIDLGGLTNPMELFEGGMDILG